MGDGNVVPVPWRVSSASSGSTLTRCTCEASITLPLMVSPWDRASILDNLRAPFAPTFHGSFEVGNRLNFCLY